MKVYVPPLPAFAVQQQIAAVHQHFVGHSLYLNSNSGNSEDAGSVVRYDRSYFLWQIKASNRQTLWPVLLTFHDSNMMKTIKKNWKKTYQLGPKKYYIYLKKN